MIKQRQGFTLIELIIVVAIIALLAGATFVALNPAKRIGEANDAQRWTDITAVANAWALYVTDNYGELPASLSSGVVYQIRGAITPSPVSHCVDGTDATSTVQYLDLSSLISGGYIGQIPSDPATTSPRTAYYLRMDDGVLRIGACYTSAYAGGPIEVMR
ncbi:MAG: type II secretion system protein [Patescibacteria group bacterium]|nr:type II secretion system protein [Patescibacteria group bacterium]